ncbi:hypothetical protein TNCV_4062031 [Trichonephila clavipes]|nr:hypothetical protein TNCV_4062031 [Trichonephila clavipes]
MTQLNEKIRKLGLDRSKSCMQFRFLILYMCSRNPHEKTTPTSRTIVRCRFSVFIYLLWNVLCRSKLKGVLLANTTGKKESYLLEPDVLNMMAKRSTSSCDNCSEKFNLF